MRGILNKKLLFAAFVCFSCVSKAQTLEYVKERAVSNELAMPVEIFNKFYTKQSLIVSDFERLCVEGASKLTIFVKHVKPKVEDPESEILFAWLSDGLIENSLNEVAKYLDFYFEYNELKEAPRQIGFVFKSKQESSFSLKGGATLSKKQITDALPDLKLSCPVYWSAKDLSQLSTEMSAIFREFQNRSDSKKSGSRLIIVKSSEADASKLKDDLTARLRKISEPTRVYFTYENLFNGFFYSYGYAWEHMGNRFDIIVEKTADTVSTVISFERTNP